MKGTRRPGSVKRYSDAPRPRRGIRFLTTTELDDWNAHMEQVMARINKQRPTLRLVRTRREVRDA